MSGVAECAVCLKKESETPLFNCTECEGRRYCGAACQESDWSTHRLTCRALNYILKVTLEPKKIKNPAITRTLCCPASASFFQLHKALQIAFGWASTHLYIFRLKPPGSSVTSCPDFPVQLEITEDEQFMPSFQSLRQVKASDIRLGEVLSDKTFKDAAIVYEYDFGDCWEHEIVVVGRAEHTDRFSCVSGEGHGAAEDVGGFTGWERMKKAYRAARPTTEQRELKNWFERQASNNDLQGLGGGRASIWDQHGINNALAGVRVSSCS